MQSRVKCRDGFTLVERTPGLFLIIVAILAVLLLPALSRSKECARRARCMSNLKQLGLAMHMYAQDYREHYPENLSQLYPTYVTSLKIFICPSKGGVTERDILRNFGICYEYNLGMTEEYDADCLLVFDRKGNHKKRNKSIPNAGRFAAFVDGHVTWILEENWEPTWQKHLSCLRQSEQRLKAAFSLNHQSKDGKL